MGKNNSEIQLTPKEEEVMQILWDNGALYVKEIVALMPDPKPHVNTISTFVRALEQKGIVTHEAHGGSFKYKALLQRDKIRKKSLKMLLKKYFNNSGIGLVSALVEDEEISSEELKELINIIESKK
ncbi:MAG: BlaI/MecI/CopY family transcriptional regulator [Muribaculaceae bacterium]